MTLRSQTASGAALRVDAAAQPAPSADAGPYVINLCSSNTPMALQQPQAPELARFSFFVSRRREDGRERFRLHMGYFQTLEEAEEWLSVVREIYPGAWAGEAPGKRLRERQAAQAGGAPSQPAQPAPSVEQRGVAATPASAAPVAATRSAPAPAARVVTAAAGQPPRTASPTGRPAAAAPMPPQNIPTVHAAPIGANGSAPVASRSAHAPVQAPSPAPRSASGPASNGMGRMQAVQAAPAAKPASQRAAGATQGQSSSRTAAPSSRAASSALPASNVREVLASLDDSAHAPQPQQARRAAVPRVQYQTPSQSLTDTQVLRILEGRRADGSEVSRDAEGSGIALLRPDDTGTRRALREAVVRNAPVSFAVQLQWSVQPIELDKVPPLAIFSAYTLYTVEGSREGRKWYGLRLGFFSDAISAKQVAYYVRSEFPSVAVVPVSSQERARATEEDNKSISLAPPPKPPRREPVDEFKLIDDEPEVKPPPCPKAPAPKPSSAGKRSGSGRVRARERRAPQTLEETLEILGASELQIADSDGDPLNDTGVRHLRVEVQKDTPFSRLLDRLTERMRK